MSDPLAGITYAIRYNPNCPSPYECRTAGAAALVDARERRNLVTHGQTLEQARDAMVAKLAAGKP